MKLLILAGHDTSAYTLTSILYLLAKNPVTQKYNIYFYDTN
jgi:cytochrome P450